MKDFKEIRNATEVFQCSCTERGRQCASEFTRANAFSPLLKTLQRKNPGGVELETIVNSAICPFHARILSFVRTDVVRMDEVLSKFFEMKRLARQEDRERQEKYDNWQRRRKRWLAANSTALGEQLKIALKK